MKDIFLGVFVEQERPAVLAHCQEHKRGHCRTGAAVSDRTRSFLSRQLLLLLNPLDSQYGERLGFEEKKSLFQELKNAAAELPGTRGKTR